MQTGATTPECALNMLSIHTPDNVFMALQKIPTT